MQRIDDRDVSAVYSDPIFGRDWSPYGGPEEYLSTASLTRKKGASVKITFTGSSIAVYGTVSGSRVDSGTTSQYSVDGGTPGTTYTTTPAREPQYGVKFFDSGSLSPGQHTLEIVNESRGGWLWLDYFDITQGNSTTTSVTPSSTLSTDSTSSTSSIPSSTSTLPVTTTSSFQDDFAPTSTSESSNASRTSKGPPAGMIVGVISGGIFVLVLFAVLIWFIRRKLADRYADRAAAIPNDFLIPPATSKAAEGFAPTHRSNESRNNSQYDISTTSHTPSNMAPVHYHQHPQLYQQQSQYGPNTSNPSLYSFSPTSGSAQPPYHAHAVNGQYVPLSYSGMQGQPQHHQQLQHAYGHHSVMASPRLGSTSDIRHPGGAGAYGQSGVSATGITSEQDDYDFSDPDTRGSSDDIPPPAYSGPPPGLPGSKAQ